MIFKCSQHLYDKPTTKTNLKVTENMKISLLTPILVKLGLSVKGIKKTQKHAKAPQVIFKGSGFVGLRVFMEIQGVPKFGDL